MPKERIYGETTEGAEKSYDATVRWGNANAVRERDADGYQGYVWLASVAQVDDREQYPVGLDRIGINKLVRALRKARDQAFGADA